MSDGPWRGTILGYDLSKRLPRNNSVLGQRRPTGSSVQEKLDVKAESAHTSLFLTPDGRHEGEITP